MVGVILLKPDDALLSHGETPHYHRRYNVSLLSSVWDQVVPELYVRQANCYALQELRPGYSTSTDEGSAGIVLNNCSANKSVNN